VSLLQRLLVAIVAVLLLAGLVLLMRHDIGRNATPKPPPGAAAAGRFWWQ
jgi:hypothetical protein